MAKRKNEMSIGEAIDAFLQQNNLKEKSLVERVISDWPRIMGKPIAENTDHIWFRDGIFHVKIAHPMWKQELMMARTHIREKLNQELGAQLIKEVKIY